MKPIPTSLLCALAAAGSSAAQPPEIHSIAATAGQVTLDWSLGTAATVDLQQSTDPGQPESWANLLTATTATTFTEPLAGPQRFYRLVAATVNYVWQSGGVSPVDAGGTHTSLAFTPSGQPAISYVDLDGSGNSRLRYAEFNGTFWGISTVQFGAAGVLILENSLAFRPDGRPALSYFSGGQLTYTFFNGSSWPKTPVDTATSTGRYSSLAFTPSGQPAISYADGGGADLKYAVFNGTSWLKTPVDTAGSVGTHTSLAFDPDGNPAISYYDASNTSLKFARFDGADWLTETVDGGDSDSVGTFTSLAFSPAGQPAISYYDATLDGDLRYAEFDGFTWQITPVDTGIGVGQHTSLAFSPAGRPAIGYHDFTNTALKFAEFNGSSWQLTPVDDNGEVGTFTSLAFAPSGQPAISYTDATNARVKYAVRAVAP